jgi:two-component system, cell cycle response regulator
MATAIDLNVMTKIRKLPTLPGVAIKLLQAIRSENPSIKEISEIISADPPLTAKVLQMVNSPFYGREQKISSLNQAMIFLGLNTVKYLALTFSLMRGLRRKTPGAFDHVQFWKDSLTGAVAAKLLAERVIRNHMESAFCLGLLQDIGVLILAEAIPDRYPDVVRKTTLEGVPLHAAEAEVLGTDHMEVGEHVARSWGLPVTFTAPIRRHHSLEIQEKPLEEAGQLTRMLQVSSHFVALFKGADPRTEGSRIDEGLRSLGLCPWTEKLRLTEAIAANIRSIFPIFEMQIDDDRYMDIIESARTELAELSGDLLREVQGQTQDLNRLKLQVGRDGLTQLDNHKRFMENLQREIGRAVRYHSPLTLVMADLDHFKSINDFFGHQAGDHALTCVSACLKQGLRDSDLIARYGGEEFAVIMPMTTMEEGWAAAERLRTAVCANKMEYKGKPISLTMSFGIAALGPQSVDAEGLIKMADEALYEAKRTGRNRSCRFSLPEAERSPAPTVLVIDDEDAVLVTVTKMLQRLGYSVLSAKSGQEGIRLFHSRPKVDMVIMDMVMPDIEPDELLKAIREGGAGTKVVLSSGYCPSSEGFPDLVRKTEGFLQKPYQLSELSKIVSTTLLSSSPRTISA